MKKLFFTALSLCFVFVSCKKDRTCSCTITNIGTNTVHTVTPGLPPLLPATDTTIVTPTNSINTQKTKYTKVSKKTMRNNCYEKLDESYSESTTNGVPGLFTITTTQAGVRTYACKIE